MSYRLMWCWDGEQIKAAEDLELVGYRAWLESKDGRECAAPGSLGLYDLENRLLRAFRAGWECSVNSRKRSRRSRGGEK